MPRLAKKKTSQTTLFTIFFGVAGVCIIILFTLRWLPQPTLLEQAVETPTSHSQQQVIDQLHPLAIERLRATKTPGSPVTIVEELPAKPQYAQYIASYESDGNTIYALLTVPKGERPETGWPAIIFNHGYIPPDEYQTTERYVAYVDTFARNGYVVLKSDYRGHGQSEGIAQGGYGSNDYTIDVLNGLASIKKLTDPTLNASLQTIVDPKRIGMWGHSMGGYITLRSMVVRKDIKAGVIWAGVVASYPDLINNWRRPNWTPPPDLSERSRSWRQELTEKYGTPEENSEFWNSISANSYLADISGPVQLHHGTADTSVPVEFSQTLEQQLQTAQQPVELYIYQGDNHNISQSFQTAMNRSLKFFDTYVKGE